MSTKVRLAFAACLGLAVATALSPTAFAQGRGGGGGHGGGGGGSVHGGGQTFQRGGGGQTFQRGGGQTFQHGDIQGATRQYETRRPESQTWSRDQGNWDRSGRSWDSSRDWSHRGDWSGHGDWDHNRWYGYGGRNYWRYGFYPWFGYSWWWPRYGFGYGGYPYYYDTYGYYPYYDYGDYGYAGSYRTAAPAETTSAPAGQDSGFYSQALTAFQSGDYGDAARLAAHASIDEPRNPDVHVLLSLALFAQGDYRGAAMEAHAVAGMKAVPDWPTVFGFYGKAEPYTEQLRALEKFVRDTPTAPEGRFLLGFHYLMAGHKDAAKNELMEGLKLAPRDALAAQLLTQAGGTVPPEIAKQLPSPNEPQQR